MEQEKLNTYSVRITQANCTQLVTITYEILIDSIYSAQEALKNNDIPEYEKDLKRVQKLLHELTGSLNYQYEISKDLLELYRFCGKCVVESIFKRDAENLACVLSVMDKLKNAFTEAEKQDVSGAVMSNTQTLYAGLTYGRHALNEEYVNINETTRGYKV